MKAATRMMLMGNRQKKGGEHGQEHQAMQDRQNMYGGGMGQMEQPRYNEDYVGRKVRERQMQHSARHSGADPLEMDGRDPYSSRGMAGYEHKEKRRHYEDDDEEEYGSRGKPQRMYAAGMAWTDEARGEHKEHKEVDEACAMKWVHAMKNQDGTRAPHFKEDLAEQMRMAHCPECKKWEWFVAINMMYADYAEVAKKLGVDRDEFYAHMAKAFLMDEDAGPHKLSKYMETIPKK